MLTPCNCQHTLLTISTGAQGPALELSSYYNPQCLICPPTLILEPRS
ncbi:hypothetical protein RSAG8_10108, partial [Rhizoctonia solani AG-8 WAC10335]